MPTRILGATLIAGSGAATCIGLVYGPAWWLIPAAVLAVAGADLNRPAGHR